MKKPQGVKVLVLDIETVPMLGYVWGLFDQNVGLNQVKSDWHVISWAAKWLGDPPDKVIQMDQRNAKNVEDDKKLLQAVWKLMDEADVIITQNGKAFDSKKLNARFILNGMHPPSSYRHIDTYIIAKKYFAFTSNKLAYMTDKLCVKYKKLSNHKFEGFELWKECLKGNKAAWKEMAKYNIYDILSLEEVYYKLIPWDNSINFSVYVDDELNQCTCGSNNFVKNGYSFTNNGRYHRYKCKKCGSEVKSKSNLLTKEKRKSLLSRTS